LVTRLKRFYHSNKPIQTDNEKPPSGGFFFGNNPPEREGKSATASKNCGYAYSVIKVKKGKGAGFLSSNWRAAFQNEVK
jgi:hypothetical protein